MQASKTIVGRALDLQEERRRANSRPLPLWVIPALLFFGWNELSGLLRSPGLLLLCLFVVFFGMQLYRDLDVDREMEKGLPAASINIGRKIVPASKRILANSGEALRGLAQTLIDKALGREDAEGVQTPERTPMPSTIGTPGRTPGRWSVAGSEVEMSPLMADSPVDGLRQRGGNESDKHSPALAGLESHKDM